MTNNTLTAFIDDHGAEPTSLRYRYHEYLWSADPTYWKRHAPILFPIVGKVWQNTYRVNDKVYHLPQHGFARDADFTYVTSGHGHCVHRLTDSPATREVYPYPFTLTATHRLVGMSLECSWEVHNDGPDTMFFQIGAHPAFSIPHFRPEAPVYYQLLLQRHGEPLSQVALTTLSPNGHALPQRTILPLEGGIINVNRDTFAHDALVIEDSQVDCVTLRNPDGSSVLRVDFDAPVLGLWSPVEAPFCCIEPWYGRTDAEGFSGDISQREHIQSLAPGKSFTFNYKITIIS